MKVKNFLVIIILILLPLSYLISHPDDIYWSRDFGMPSTDEVRAAVVDGDYVYYNEFGGIVRWNLATKGYEVLGLSELGTVNTIVKHNEYIYIGGSFQNFAGTGADFIARWDGEKWEKVVDSLDGKVMTICFDDDGGLWIGGMFKNVNGINSPYIALRKDGKWQKIPELNNQVRSIINVNGKIYAGGDFYFEDNMTKYITCVVKWNEGSWSAVGGLGNQCGSRVFSLAASPDGKIYAGGMFFKDGDNEISQNVAVYDGLSWKALGKGFDDMVFILEWHNGKIYAGGYFDKSGENECKKIAVFESGEWYNVDGGFEGGKYPTVLTLVSADDYLYCGGNFNKSGSIENWGFVRLNPAGKWENFLPVIRNGTVSGVLCFTIDRMNNILYAGGGFVKTGKVVSYGISKFNGTEWIGCNNGLTPTSNSAYYMQAVNDTVYFTGWFNFADGIRLRNVAKWIDHLHTWEPVGNGIEGADFDLGPIRVTGKDIYVGGDFKTVENGSDTIFVNYVTRWDGEKWNVMDGGIGRTGGRTPRIKQIIQDGNLLYITGLFDLAGRGVVNNVAVWDIDKLHWVASDIDIHGTVNDLYIDGDDFYFGGSFQKAGDLKDVNNIVKWNRKTNTWTKLADGVDGSVSAITKWGDDIYVGGWFKTASGVTCNSIAKYNVAEDKFEPLGSGVQTVEQPGVVRDIIVYKNELYLGGSFKTAGGNIAASNIAKWTKAPLSVESGQSVSDIKISLFPVPANDLLNIEISPETQDYITLELYDLSGNRLNVIYRGDIPAGKNYYYFRTGNLAQGIYLLVCHTKSGTVSKKVIVEK